MRQYLQMGAISELDNIWNAFNLEKIPVVMSNNGKIEPHLLHTWKLHNLSRLQENNINAYVDGFLRCPTMYMNIGRMLQQVCKFHYPRKTVVCCRALVMETYLNNTCILHYAATRLCWSFYLCCAHQRSVCGAEIVLAYKRCFRVISKWK